MNRTHPGRSRRRGEQGYVAVLVAIMAATVILPLCAIAVDVARWYVEVERMQNAADAASMAGVTYLPDDMDSARATAIAVSARNGFPNSGTSSVTVATGSKPTQLKVTVSSTVRNTFGAAFGIGSANISRFAVADYNGPAPMGSPCNAFANEPTAGAAEPLGPGSQIVPPIGGAVCTSSPKFWAAIAGPETPKGNGDAIMTRRCSSGNDDCTGTTNDEFEPMGYFYIIRVAQAAVNQPVTLQVYDPAFVETGDRCAEAVDSTNIPAGTTLRDNMSTYTADGNTRYAKTPGAFCAGDTLTSATAEAPVTSFVVRGQTDTYRPATGVPITGCVKQYKGYREGDTIKASSSRLRQIKDDGAANANYNTELAKVFHQWVTLCTFTPTVVGDHYLQVRTNVALGGTADGAGGYGGNANAYTQTGDDTSVDGNGNNRFALRVTGPARGSVSISGWEHMGIYANSTAATTEFNHVRVIPAAASKTLNIRFFDTGDADAAGTIQVLPPLESNLPTPLEGLYRLRRGGRTSRELPAHQRQQR